MSVAFQTQDEWRNHYRAVRARLHTPPKKVEPPPAPKASTSYRVRDIIDLTEWPRLYLVPIGPEREMANHEKAKIILYSTAKKYGYTVVDLRSDRRDAYLVACRQEACWEIKNQTTWSLPHIGRFMGGRDHTTILHAIRKHQARVDGAVPMLTRNGHKPLTAAEHIARKEARQAEYRRTQLKRKQWRELDLQRKRLYRLQKRYEAGFVELMEALL